MTDSPGIAWLARHEFRLAWRDFLAMITAGRPGRKAVALSLVAVAVVILHAIAWVILAPAHAASPAPATIIAVTSGLILLAFSLMGSQAMESITRLFYARSDLDLVLASPYPIRVIFGVRIAAIAVSTTTLSLLLMAPAVHILAFLDGPGWLLAYPFAFSLGCLATVAALCITLALFRLLGARRTRIVAQIVAALIGAGFIIGIQIAAISTMGTLSRIAFFKSEYLAAHLPDLQSPLWIPARAAMGQWHPFVLVTFASIAMFALAVLFLPERFARTVLAAAGVDQAGKSRQRKPVRFRSRSPLASLRAKEWRLLARDHWLISQTLMQVLYLAPPAFMLWQGFGGDSAIAAVAIPVIVMATGQLSGGLAWLAISGEDAPQLVATAPVSPSLVIQAKIQAVLGAIAVIVLPILAILALIDIHYALICAVAISAAVISATAIQLWFRSQARRSNFRRRQTSSRIATFAEAFSSIFWAGAAALWAYGSLFALALVGLAIAVLAIAWFIRPNPTGEFAF